MASVFQMLVLRCQTFKEVVFEKHIIKLLCQMYTLRANTVFEIQIDLHARITTMRFFFVQRNRSVTAHYPGVPAKCTKTLAQEQHLCTC